jgi:hypothetical protein
MTTASTCWRVAQFWRARSNTLLREKLSHFAPGISAIRGSSSGYVHVPIAALALVPPAVVTAEHRSSTTPLLRISPTPSRLKAALQMYPQHPQQRSQVDRWMHWHHTASRRATTNLLIPFLVGKAAEVVADGREEVAQHVQVALRAGARCAAFDPSPQYLERHLSSIQDDPSRIFLAGGCVSISDLLVVTGACALPPTSRSPSLIAFCQNSTSFRCPA